MKHLAPFLLSLLLALSLCGCELIKDDPIPPRPAEVTRPAVQKTEAMPIEDFYGWMGQYTDMSRYTQTQQVTDSVTYTLQDVPKYPLDFTVTVEEQTFTLPLTYDGMLEAGWDIELGKADAEIDSNYALEATWRRDGKLRMILRAGNLHDKVMAYRELPLYRMKFVFRTMEDDYEALLTSAPHITFSGLDETADLTRVIGAFGPPTELTYGLAKSGKLSYLDVRFVNSKRDFLDLRFSGDGRQLCELLYSKDPT